MKEHMNLEYQIECIHDVAVVGCSGRLVRSAALDEFRNRLERLEGIRVLVLDLSEVDQIDAGGLSTMLMLRRWAMQRSAKIKLVDPTPFVRRVLEATHLASIFEIATFEEALCILRAPQCPVPNYATA